jgi:GT2 family glycosyltransferase
VERVSVAVVSWNGLEHLKVCLAALAAQDDPGLRWEVLVLDNGSRDGTADWIRRHHPEVRIIVSPVNLGFCAGNNRLVQEARGDAVALLNNDARPAPDWLRALVHGLRSSPSDVAAISGMILDWEGERLDFAQGIMTFDGHAFQQGYHRPLDRARLPATGSEILFPCGGNMMIRRRAFVESGGFDEDFFAYLEDVDLGWRLWSRGQRVTFTREAVVYHRSMATSDLLGLYNRGFLFERNAFLTAYKNYEPGVWEQIMPAIFLTLTSRTQTLLVHNNPGGSLLALDPYAGLIADTEAPRPGPDQNHPREPLLARIADRWRRYGTRELVRRGARRALSTLWRARSRPGTDSHPSAGGGPVVNDPRTVAQLRAVAYLLGHLDDAARKRACIQQSRRRSDREIFERFPLYLIPTYPGDEELFASAGFQSWLPEDLPLVRSTLEEIMALEEG